MHSAAPAKPPSQKYVQGGGAQLHADFVVDERDQRSHLKWMHLWLSECASVLKEGAPVPLFTDWRQLPLTAIAGFTWCDITVWDKTEGVRPQMGRFRNQSGYIVWGSKGNMPRDRRAPVLPGVIRESVRKVDKHHLTGKPTELMRQLVRICELGGCVLNPFAGSGATLLAAQLEGYR
ncbi:adenine methyltransferase [Xanthomonas arboricola pv. arracaciae]|nr:adenine methyltransferase [Xanthomonas arboricola pv. arracaciae]